MAFDCVFSLNVGLVPCDCERVRCEMEDGFFVVTNIWRREVVNVRLGG